MSERVPLPLRVQQIVAWVLACMFALWALGRVVGLDRGFPLVQLIAFTPYVAGASLLGVAACLVVRQWWAAGLCALACVALLACVLPRSVGSASTMDGVPLVVMSMNMLEGGADAETIVGLVRDQQVDVLTIQEFTPEAKDNLTKAGLTELLPYDETWGVKDTRGSALYSRFPLSDEGVTVNEGSFLQAFAVVHPPGAEPVAVVSVHPLAPADRTSVPLWRQDLRNQRDDPPTGPAQILAGDFNATLDHSELRRLIDTGYHDAAYAVGAGLTPTWPYHGHRSYVTPKVTIDHVLVDHRIGVRTFSAHTVPRTDHRAIITTLTLPPPP